MNHTSIAWVRNPDGSPGYSWNCFAGCQHLSDGCKNCWAARLAATRLERLPAYKGLATSTRSFDYSGKPWFYPQWTGEVRFFSEKLAEPLHHRKPAGIFVGGMGDIALLTNMQISAIFGVMAACPQHTFYVLTKRAKRMREWFEWLEEDAKHDNCTPHWLQDDDIKRKKRSRSSRLWMAATTIGAAPNGAGSFPMGIDQISERGWPLPNVHFGVTVENKDALPRVEELARTPAAYRFLSMEPLLEPVLLKGDWASGILVEAAHDPTCDGSCRNCPVPVEVQVQVIDWVVCGGESGPNARPCHVDWIRSIVDQCRDAGVECWVKQYGSNAIGCLYDLSDNIVRELDAAGFTVTEPAEEFPLPLRSRAGSDPSEWSQDMRVRQLLKVET